MKSAAEAGAREPAYWIAFAVCLTAASVPFLAAKYLPMADLPEHAAQVAVFKAFDDPCYRFDRVFEFNWATPYLLGYLIARAFAAVVTVHVAIKLTVFVWVLLLPLSMRVLLLRSGGDPWLSLLGFPLAFGFSFYWGFLNFGLAIALGILHIAVACDVLRRPGRRNVAALVILSFLLLIAHALMLIISAAVAAILSLFEIRRARFVLAAIIPALVVFGAWVMFVRSVETAVHRDVVWHLGFYRATQLPSILLSNAWDTWAAVFIAAVIATLLLLGRPRVVRDGRRWIVLAVALTLYFFAPLSAFGSAFLFQRLAVLIAAGALLVVDLSARRRHLYPVLVILVITWMGVLTVRFVAFDREAREFDAVVERLPTNRRLLVFNMNAFSDAVPGPVFLHFAGYYQMRKGGLAAWSFANYYPQLIRYSAGAEPRVASSSVPQGRPVDWAGVAHYDFIAVRAKTGAPAALMSGAPFRTRLLLQRGSWWLFETPRASQPAASCPPLE